MMGLLTHVHRELNANYGPLEVTNIMKAILCMLLTLCLVACAKPDHAMDRTDHTAAESTLRVLTYNLHHGAGEDGRIDLQRIADVIMSVSPDLVALQEVDKGVERTGGVDQPAVLADLTGMHVVFEKNIDFQGGEYGNAVLSRLPIESYRNHKLPQLTPDEQRGMLEVRVRLDDRPIVFYATHFDYHGDDEERLASAELFRDMLSKQPVKTVILAGDLNARPDSPVLVKLYTFLIDAHAPGSGPGYTYPADVPDRRIDYILHTPDAGLRTVESRVLDEPIASDHRPLLTVFELTGH